MADKSIQSMNDFLNYALRNVAPSWGSSAQLYISLHVGSPSVGGDQTTNELDYVGYARLPIARNSSGRPATSPEAREGQMVSLAVDLAEKKLRDGSAPPSMIIHYLKLGTTREALEQERLKQENLMLAAKTEALASSARSEETLAEAIKAFTSYRSSEMEEE